MKKVLLFFQFLCVFSLFSLEEGELQWEATGPSVQEYNRFLKQAMEEGRWWDAIDYAEVISYNFPTSPFAQDMSFVMGEAYFNMGQLELANQCFSTYLNKTTSPRHFEKTIEYKFNIAEQFKSGVKKPLFGSHKMPKIVPAKEDALVIYDEVITTVPHSEWAAQALIGKAKIQTEFEDYKPSVETLDLLIRRFPKHDLAAEAYLEKMRVYLKQCQGQNLDADILDLAEVNLRKFRLAFPREARISEAEQAIADMQEIFAQNLLDTGRFFEKTKKIPASLIYYNKVVAKYPKTNAAVAAKENVERLQPASTQ